MTLEHEYQNFCDVQKNEKEKLIEKHKKEVRGFYMSVLQNTKYDKIERQALVKKYAGESVLIELLTELLPAPKI